MRRFVITSSRAVQQAGSSLVPTIRGAATTSASRVLLVNHRYPPTYNAGSEIYSQMVARELARQGIAVSVFSRKEDPFLVDYDVSRLVDESGVALITVNYARAMSPRYTDSLIDAAFSKVVQEERPEVVHFQHLSHLSLGLPSVAKNHGAAVFYTMHDYWLSCLRGQYLQTGLDGGRLWAACDGPRDDKCASRCLSRFATGAPSMAVADTRYWEATVAGRRSAVQDAMRNVDLFIAPSRYLRERMLRDAGLPRQHTVVIPYGFDKSRMADAARVAGGRPFTFGFLGRHVAAKGIDDLIAAFRGVNGDVRLRIWGRPEPQVDASLRALAGGDARVTFEGEYNNSAVGSVLSEMDALVVPSRWVENAPLVIHEAQQVRLPVITANAGGMAELVRNGMNGLTYDFRSVTALSEALQWSANNPAELAALGQRGYLYSENGDVPCIKEHVSLLRKTYDNVLETLRAPLLQPAPILRRAGPSRVTFDTNPDTCNFACTMCEGFSEHSSVQKDRAATGRKRRVMDPALVEATVRDLMPYGLREIIPSTMGEPLMYKHFDVFLRLCRENAPLKLNLTTNGSFPANRHVRVDGVEAWAKLLLPILSDVKISWNGATADTAEKVMKGSRFDTVLSNVAKLIDKRDELAAARGNRASVTLQLTFMETNSPEFPAVIRLAAALGVDRVKGHHLWAHWKEISDQDMRRSPAAKGRWNAIAAECRAVAAATPRKGGGTVALQGFEDLSPSPAAVPPDAACPFLGKELWLNAEGVIAPCCAPDVERMELGSFGRVRQEGDVLAAWRSQSYADLLQTYPNRAVCSKCTMRRRVQV